jgi:hypothetical protein
VEAQAAQAEWAKGWISGFLVSHAIEISGSAKVLDTLPRSSRFVLVRAAQAKTGDTAAVIVVLKIQTRRAHLLGLDAPIRHHPAIDCGC